MYEHTYRIRINIDPAATTSSKSTTVNTDGIYERLKQLKRAIPHIQVKGLPQIRKGVISKEDFKAKPGEKPKPSKYTLLLDGYGLSEVMGIDGERGIRAR